MQTVFIAVVIIIIIIIIILCVFINETLVVLVAVQ